MRLVLSLLGLLSALFAPYYITALFIIALCVRYRAYEAVALGLILDFLWQPAGAHLPFFTVIALVSLWGFEPLRREFLS